MKQDKKMRAVVEAYHKSGMGATKFASIENLNIHQLKCWINKLKKKKACKASFLEINSTPAIPANDWVEIEYPNGVKVKLTTKEAPFLSQLIRVY
jgi:hypothetical protein